MPASLTHNYFAKDCLNKCSKNIQNIINKNIDTYLLFANGFDPFFIYSQFHKKETIGNRGHQTKTDTYFLNLIKLIKEKKLENNSLVLTSLFGHLTHYVLDSNIHPFIIYKSGEYNKNKSNTIKYNGLHYQYEMQIDAYLYEQKENNKFKNFKIHTIFPKVKLDKNLIDILNQNYEEVFNIKNYGIKYQKSLILTHYAFKFIVEDKTGIKKFIYNLLDKITPKKEGKFKNYSNNIKFIDLKILNLNNNLWFNPWNKEKSNESFFDLYNKSLDNCLELFDYTYKYLNDLININEYKKVLKDKSYVTGLSWKNTSEIKYLEF